MKYLSESISNWKFNEATWASLNHFNPFPILRLLNLDPSEIIIIILDLLVISTNPSRNFPFIFNSSIFSRLWLLQNFSIGFI